MLDILIRFSVKAHKLILFIFILLAGFSIYYARNLNFQTNFADLLPQTQPSVRDLNSVTKKAGGVGFLLLSMEAPKLTPRIREFAEKIAIEIGKLPRVKYVIYRKYKNFFDPRALFFLDTKDLVTIRDRVKTKITSERKKVNPFYFSLDDDKDKPLDFSDIEAKYEHKKIESNISDFYENKAQNLLAMRIKPAKPSTDLEFSKKLLVDVQNVIDRINPKNYDKNLNVELLGRYKILVEENSILRKDLSRSFLIAIFLAILIILLATKRKRSIFIITVPLLVSISIIMGMTMFFIGHVNLITAFLGAIFMGLGVDFGIHLFIRYQQERDSGQDIFTAIKLMLKSTGRASITAATTTSATFLTLTIMKFKGFSEFGFIAGWGMLIILVVILIMTPAILIFMDRAFGEWKPRKNNINKKNVISRFYLYNIKNPKKIIILWGIVIILGGIATNFVKFEGDFRKLRAKGQSYDKQDYVEEQVFGSAISPAIILTKTRSDAKKIADIINRIKKESRKLDRSYIDEVVTIPTLIPKNQEAKYIYIKELNKLSYDKVLDLLEGNELERIEDIRRLTSGKPYKMKDMPRKFVDNFILDLPNGEKNWVIMMFPQVMHNENFWDLDTAFKYAAEIYKIRKYAKLEGVDYELVSGTMIYVDIMKLVISETPIALLFALLAVFLILMLDFRSLRKTILMIVPLGAGTMLIVLLMAIFRLDLTFMNVIVFPTLFGIGIDSVVHIFHRYKEAGLVGLNLVMDSVGVAIFLSMITTLVGFGSLATAQNHGLQGIGWIAIVGVASVFLASVSLYPALLELLERRRIKKESK